MSDPALPQIKVVDTQNPDRSAGTGPLESPSTATDGGQSQRPKSATSSEGNTQTNGKNPPASLIRNVSSRDINGGKPITAAPPTVTRPSAIDPLSIHILKRTNTENTIPQKLRNTVGPTSPNADAGSPISPEVASPGRQLTPEIVRSDSNPSKEKKKGVSFLSRFSIIGGKKKDQSMDVDDDESELGDTRTEGMNAHVFSSSIGANGYIPLHKEPPRYIKVRAHHKKVKEFGRMFLAQELSGTKHAFLDDKVPGLTTFEIGGANHPHKLSKEPKSGGAVWATEFSKDGRYLAAAGRDMVVRVWAVISTPEERKAHEHEEDVSSNSEGGERLSAPVFMSKPVREFQGHTGEILDLSWSKNNFLLSSSMDKTVRLWHMSRPDALVTFKHKDFGKLTNISCVIDMCNQVSVRGPRLEVQANINRLAVTSIAFHPRDDRFFLAGSLDSILRLWSIPDKSVAYWAQLPDLITAVAFTPDGKIAMAGVLSGLCLFYETEGLKYQAQIHVRSSRGKNAKGSKVTGIRTITFPPDDPNGEVKVLITSNDSRVRIYNLKDKSLETKLRGHENTCSQINASFSDDARYVITGSEDKRCYLWTLGPSDNEKRPLEFFEAHSDIVTAAIIAPTQTRRLLSTSGDPIYDLCNPPPVTLLSREESQQTGSEKRYSGSLSELNLKKPEESPAYLARSSHNDGAIIVTADYLGCIKVYRCDCASKKRTRDNWETGSMRKIIRTGSIMTKNSGSSHSRRNSVNQNFYSPHIESWRNGITDDGNGSIRSNIIASRDSRSISPGKFNNQRASSTSQSTTNSQTNLANASAARQQQYASTPLVSNPTPSVSTTSPPPSIYKATRRNSNYNLPPTPSFTFQSAKDDNSLRIDAAGHSNTFWNLSSWKNQFNSNHDPGKFDAENLQPPMERGPSFVSKLSSDEGSAELDEESENEMTCKKCSGKDFRAKKSLRGLVMVCKSCGETLD